MVTMNDIAKKAGVTRQAVSSVLNDPENSRVSAVMKEKIFRLVREMNYIPNTAAKILKGGSSGSIGLLGQVSSFGVQASRISELGKQLRKYNYDMLLNDCPFGDGSDEELVNGIRTLEMKGIDGIIIFSSRGKWFDGYRPNVPFLLYSHDNLEGYDIGVDDELGGYMAARHLLEHGHRNIAYLCIRTYQLNSARRLGWQRACEEAGCYNPEHCLVTADWNGETAPLVDELKKKKITAVFAFNDHLAGRFMSMLFSHGLRVPEDIALIGYDGQSFCDFCRTPLATIVQPVRKQAELGIEMLLERMKSGSMPPEPEYRNVEPFLYCSASCGCHSSALDRLYTLNTYSTLEMDYKMNFDIDIFKQ